MLLEKIHLEDDEEVITTIRKHWFVIAVRFFGLAVLAFAPLVLDILLRSQVADGTFLSEAQFAAMQPYYVFGSALWLLMLIMAAAAAWTHYYLDLWVVTTRRVVLVDQRGFFRRFVSSFRLERLQDMNIEINGLIPTLLNFGTVEAQTAGGSNERFETHNLPDPRAIKALIISAADDLTATQAARIETLRQQGL